MTTPDIAATTARTRQQTAERSRAFLVTDWDYTRAALTCIALYDQEAAETALRLAEGFAQTEGAEDCERAWLRVAAAVAELRYRADENLSSGTTH